MGLTDGKGNPIVKYTYDAAGRLSEKDMGNGTYTKYAYDLSGSLTSIVNYAPDKSVISEELYTYDDQGRPISVTTLNGTTTYGYDATGQLTSVNLPGGRTITYKYDAAGNRVSVTDSGVTTNYTTNNLNEYTQVGSTQYAYDKDGNLISQTDTSGTTTYGYNLLGQLVSVASPTGTWTYQYDALGNRVSETQNGQETQYLIDPTGIGNVVGTFDSSGNPIAHYTQGFGLTSQVSATGATYYNFDLTGNTTELTGASGSVLSSYSYLPYGNVLSVTGMTSNPFTYVGQFGVMSDGSGQYFMRNRWYVPTIGRFTQPDPTQLEGGDTDWYRYTNNSPILLIDVTGLCSLSTADITSDVLTVSDNAITIKQGLIQQYRKTANIGELAGKEFQLLNTEKALATANRYVDSPVLNVVSTGTDYYNLRTTISKTNLGEANWLDVVHSAGLLAGDVASFAPGPLGIVGSLTGLIDQASCTAFQRFWNWRYHVNEGLSPEAVRARRESFQGKLFPLPVLIEDL